MKSDKILAAIEALKEELNRQNMLLHFLINGLRQDNRDLLNRFMANFNMTTYAQTSPASVAEMDAIPASQLAKQDDFGKEHFAGDIVE